MTTTIHTNPAASFTVSDTNTADTITVGDGPAENGFQTTQITTAANTAIFANKTNVVIDGGNKNDKVVLDNPDPAAGLLSLTIQNLGTGEIDGGNSNANSPDIAVGGLALFLNTGDIGHTRALQTQANTLTAETNGGNINITNGVRAPTTLNIGILQASGGIVLANNGTINDFNSGITAIGNIFIDATGATADFNTGSGAGIISTAGSIINGVEIGEDTNLGDGVGGGSMSAAAGINWMTGRNFTMNANASVTNSTSGNIIITAGGNITLLTSPDGLANAPEIVDNASGGSIALTAGSGKTLTVDSTGATAIASNNGAIFLAADAMLLNKGIISGTQVTSLAPASIGQAISLGGNDAPGVLGLTQAELNLISASVLRIGSNIAGNITIAAPITESGANTLALINSGSISEAAFGSLHAANLRVSSAGPVILNSVNNGFSTVAADVAGPVILSDGPNTLTIGIVDGAVGIATNNSAVNLTADNINISQSINAGTGIVTIAPSTSSQTVALGGADAAGTLGLADTELGQITASVLRVDSGLNAGINVTGTVARHAGYNTLSLTTPQSINQTAALAVANLALNAGSAITLTNSGNSVDTLAFVNTSLSVSFTNGSGARLTIGAVDGLTSSWNAGTTTTISTGANLSLATGLSSAGATTLTSASGKIRDGANGAIVDVTAPSLGLSASTGIGTAGDPLQTQVGTLNAVTSTGGVFINNDRAVPGTLKLGNGGGGLKVGGASGDIVLTNNGTIDSVNNGDNISGPGNITVKAQGATADLNISGQMAQFSVTDSGSGLIDLKAGRDVTLGGSVANSLGAILSSAGSIVVGAGRNFTINPNAYLNVASGSGGITVSAGGDFTMLTPPASLSSAPYFQTAGGAITLSAGAQHSMTLASTGTNAVSSNDGNISLTADTLNINQGVNAGSTGNVLIQPVTAGQPISLGTATGGLNLTSAELNLVTAKNLTIGNASAAFVTLGGTVKPTNVTNLTITTGGNFTATAGSGLGATGGTVTINFGQNGLGATADLTNVAFSSTNFVIGGSGNDTFIPNPATISTFTGGGGTDTFKGTATQLTLDTITDISSGDKIVITDGNLAHFSYHLNGSTLSFDPDTSISQTFGTLTLSNAPLGHFIASADPVSGVDLTYYESPPSDFTGNGFSDLLWQNNNGTPAIWEMNGTSVIGNAALSNPGSAWHLIGTGAFNRGGKSDLLWQNNDGTPAIWEMNGTNVIVGGTLFDPGSAWHLIPSR